MSDQLLVRDVPIEIRSWIDQERRRLSVTQKEFILQVLHRARSETSPLGLFEPVEQKVVVEPDGLPFKFIDLFAGIGGLRLGLDRVGGECVFSSEWDKYAQRTYAKWFGEMPYGDIREINPDDIPDHDVLAAGFPCQPFSIAGVSKKNSLGREHGFKDQAQGTLFYNVATIVERKRPPVVLLENVKNLRSHDKKRTFQVIKGTLEDLRYSVFVDVIDAAFWVPQHRERIFLVCFDREVFGKNPPFEFPAPPDEKPTLASILETNVDEKYTLSDHLWQYLQDYKVKHTKKGNGFGYGLVTPDMSARTLSARYYKDGSEILIDQGNERNPRRLTPREAARLMGFPDELPIIVSDTQAYRQFGNAVVPPVAEALARQIVKVFHWHLSREEGGCLVKRPLAA